MRPWIVAALATASIVWLLACEPPAAEVGAPEPAPTGEEAAEAPHPEAPPQRLLKDYGPDARRVTVIVLPGDATVEVDGVPTRRRDGVVELIGKIGESRHLRVLQRQLHLERDVLIQATGASPGRLDLASLSAAHAPGPGGKGPAVFPVPPLPNPLLPDVMQ